MSFEDDLQRSGDIVNGCPDTGKWLLQADEFINWLDPDSPSSIMWLSGIPGSGKTTLCYIGMSYAKRRLKLPAVLGLFLSDRNGYRNTAVMVLRTLIYHLLEVDRHLLPILNELKESPETDLRSTKFLEANLMLFLSSTENKTIYIFLDGIDEFDDKERKPLMGILLRLLDAGNVRLLISSRALADLKLQLSKFPQVIANERNEDDIHTYVESEKDELVELFSISITEAEDILRPISRRSEGMFLYARLVILNLRGQGTRKQLREAAKDLPQGLGEAYARILARIETKLGPAGKLAKGVLEFLSCVRRSPRLIEIQHAITIELDSTCVSEDRMLRRQLDELCGPILEIRHGYVSFVHFTAKEYLLSDESGPYIDLPTAHLKLAVLCLTYLRFDAFSKTLDHNEIATYINKGEYFWLSYAESNWLEHVKSGSKVDLQNLGFLCSSLWLFFSHWGRNKDVSEDLENPFTFDFGFSAFRESAPDVCQTLVKAALYKSQGQRGRNIEDPLTLGDFSSYIWEVFDEVTEPLSDGGGQDRMNLLVKFYGSFLFKCKVRTCAYFEKGFASKFQRDLHAASHERPFKCNVSSCEYSHFGFASRDALRKHERIHKDVESNIEMIAALHLPERPDNLPSEDANKLLCDAVSAGDVQQVLAALDKGATSENGIRPQELYSNFTPILHVAVMEGTIDTVRILLEHGADVNKVSGVETALSLAAERGSVEMALVLLEHGADVRATSEPLYQAARSGSLELTRLLLDRGAEVNKTTTNWRGRDIGSPLIGAVSSGRAEIVSLLLSYGAEPNMVVRKSVALLWTNSMEIVHLLLEHGADPNLSAIEPPALCQAARRGFVELVRLLLERGADPNGKTTQSYTALGCAANRASTELTELLLQHGAQVNLGMKYRKTALIVAANSTTAGGAAVMKSLLEAGADPYIKDSKDRAAGDMKGAQQISKWLGMSWEELIEATRNLRPQQSKDVSE